MLHALCPLQTMSRAAALAFFDKDKALAALVHMRQAAPPLAKAAV